MHFDEWQGHQERELPENWTHSRKMQNGTTFWIVGLEEYANVGTKKQRLQPPWKLDDDAVGVI